MKLLKIEKKGVKKFPQIIAVIIAQACLSACGATPPSIIPFESEVAWTKEELIEVYWEYKEELDEVAEIVLASESLYERMRETNDDGFISSEAYKKYFSEGDWEKIVDLFEKIRPSELIRSLRLSDDVVSIDFKGRNVEGDHIWASLYYFKNPETAEAYKGYSFVGDGLEHLDGYWYINEKLRETRGSK